MLAFPPGFDLGLLNSDMLAVVSPFAFIAFLFAAYRLITRSGRML